MASDTLSDIQTTPHRQQTIQKAKHSSVTSQEILYQHHDVRNLEYPTTPMDLQPDHEATTMLSDSTSISTIRRYSWWQSIGPMSASILIVTTLVILASFFILILLWKGAEDSINYKNPKLHSLWRTIVFKNWTTRVITICSATIRTSVSLQIGVLVSALAAIILETSGARLVDIPVFSIERIQSNPIGILPVVVRQTMNSHLGALHSFIISTTVIVLLVSNLNSTILLSDLGMAQIPEKPVVNDTAISYENYPGLNPDDISWKTNPSAQWRFGEARFGESQVGDTGRVYRAFLPFQDEDSRTALEYYSGPAVVANTRTICVPLTLDKFSIESNRQGPYTVENAPKLWLRETQHGRTFECAIHPRANRDGHWATTLCPGINRHVQHQFLDDLKKDKSKLFESEDYSMHKILILNTTADIQFMDDTDTVQESETPKRLRTLSTKMEGLWTKVYDTTGMEIMAATSCYYNVWKAGLYNVTMTGDAIPKEPHWDPEEDFRTTANTTIHESQEFYRNKTKDILTQFGIGVKADDMVQRGILKLKIIPPTDKTNLRGSYWPSLFEEPLEDILNEKSIASNTTWDMSDDRSSQPWAVHQSHCLVFQNILRQTGDPALAIQSILTRLHQVAYYGQMDYYDLIYPVTTMHLTKQLMPVQWLGLGLVIGMTAVHLIQVLVIMVMFLSRTRLSALGNAWQAVAQATHVTKALKTAESDLDKEIGEWAKKNGHGKDIYVLSPSREDGVVELRRRQRRG